MNLKQLILIFLFALKLFSETFGEKLSLIFNSPTYKIEIGVDFPYYQSFRFQNEFVSDIHTIDFQNGLSFFPSPYLSFKSQAYSIFNFAGLYLNSNLQYSNFNKQVAVFKNGSIYDCEVDLGTSINLITFDLNPSLFFYYDFGKKSGENSLVLEFFSGVGLSLYMGNKKDFIYPTKEEFYSEKNATNFQISSDGVVVYLGDVVDLGFGFGLNLNYGLKVKYIYNNYNVHLTYQSPLTISIEDYINSQRILFGIGYSF